MWGFIIILFVSMWVFQILLSARQLKHYNSTIQKMSKQGHGYLGVGVDKRRFGVGSVVIIVCNESGTILKSQIMKGVTVFQRFKDYQVIINDNIFELSNENHEHYDLATSMAIKKITTQMN